MENEDPLNAAVAYELSMARDSKRPKMTNAELVKRTGMNYATLGRMLRGERPISVSVLVAIANGLDVPPIEIIARAEARVATDASK